MIGLVHVGILSLKSERLACSLGKKIWIAKCVNTQIMQGRHQSVSTKKPGCPFQITGTDTDQNMNPTTPSANIYLKRTSVGGEVGAPLGKSLRPLYFELESANCHQPKFRTGERDQAVFQATFYVTAFTTLKNSTASASTLVRLIGGRLCQILFP